MDENQGFWKKSKEEGTYVLCLFVHVTDLEPYVEVRKRGGGVPENSIEALEKKEEKGRSEPMPRLSFERRSDARLNCQCTFVAACR